MSVAYLVLAHNTPNHLARLVAALDTPSSGCFVHVDRKADLAPFVRACSGDVVFTRQRVPVYWGEFSMVEAIVVLLEEALRDPRCFRRFVLLSGADYPLRPAEEIEAFFASHPEREFINLAEMPAEWAGKPLWRLDLFVIPSEGASLGARVRAGLIKLGVVPGVRDHTRHLQGLRPYGGSTWWALTREACEHLVRFYASERRVVEFFRYTSYPDESFFHTVIGNSPFGGRVSRNLTYDDWSTGGANPAVLTEGHIADFRTTKDFSPDNIFGPGPMLFARKFPDASEALVRGLDV
jgi:hypothetical protein